LRRRSRANIEEKEEGTMRKRLVLSVLLASLAAVAAEQRPRELRPGFNLFSKEQDIQLGKEAAEQIAKEYVIVNNPELSRYVENLARKLWTQPEADNYPYSMRVVHDDTINAFALPGGPMFVHTGLIKAADNEAQLAGVLAHEISHVALRHGTNQVSRANLIQLPALLAGALAGSGGGMLGQLAQLGIGLGANSLLLKYSRSAERDADLLGARIMSRAGYNPMEMARFFEKLEAEGGQRIPQFLSSHPNPGNRVKAVEEEIRLLPPREYNANTGQFARAKQIVAQLPPAPKKVKAAAADLTQIPRPAATLKDYETSYFRIRHPGNWQVYAGRQSAEVTIAPPEGVGQSADGQALIGMGVIVNLSRSPSGRVDLERDTDALLEQIVKNNPGARVERSERVTLRGQPAIRARLLGPSPFRGQTEIDTVITTARPQGLAYLILITPQSVERDLAPVYSGMLNSLEWR
jgi:Zn-dependent protease with chaperone function